MPSELPVPSLDNGDELHFWWLSYGPGTALGKKAHQRDPDNTEQAWQRAKEKLLAGGLPDFRLDNTFDDSDYTVERASRRQPVEEAYPEARETVTQILDRFPDIRNRRRGP